MASFAPKVSATYFVSIDEKVTIACLFELQLTGLPFGMKIKSEIDFVVALSLS